MLGRKGYPNEVAPGASQIALKKSDATLQENYRPISLLSIGYKVLATLIHQRLLNGGCEERMRHTQFGFRPKRGTGDALMIIRRIIDAAHMANAGGISILLLDWAKAFDRLKPYCMCDALGRFGVPDEMVDMIRSIYRARYF